MGDWNTELSPRVSLSDFQKVQRRTVRGIPYTVCEERRKPNHVSNSSRDSELFLAMHYINLTAKVPAELTMLYIAFTRPPSPPKQVAVT